MRTILTTPASPYSGILGVRAAEVMREHTVTAEAIAAEPHTATKDDLQESEVRLHRELQHYTTKADLKDTELRLGTEISSLRTDLKDTELRLGADLKDTELRVQTNIRDTELRVLTKLQEVQVELQGQIKDAQMWLLLRLGGLIVASVTVAVAVLKLLS